MKTPKVLIVDDDVWLAEQQSRLLKIAGYDVLIVTDSFDAIEAIDKHRPDVVVLDLMLGGPNGIVLLHELRSHSDLARIRVIFCTNSSQLLTEVDTASYGISAVLDKTTMHPNELVAAVRKVLL
jgi:two-component system response regulator MprA